MTRYAIPDPPPADVLTLWDAHGIKWHLHPSIDDHWCVDHGVMAVDWDSLVCGYGPLSDTPPEETP